MYTKKKKSQPSHPAPSPVKKNVLHLCICYLLDVSELKMIHLTQISSYTVRMTGFSPARL